MDKFDRIFKFHSILAGRRTGIEMEDLEARLECKRSTLFRLARQMKDQLGAPIKYDSDRGGWLYEREHDVGAYQLPGLWLSAFELQALIVVRNLLDKLGSGLLNETIAPLADRVDQLIRHRRLNLSEAAVRIRFPALAARDPGDAFQIVGSATLQRKKLWFQYRSRDDDRVTDRTVSPQRLTHYRESWYLDVWDECKQALRTFSVDCISHARVLDEKAHDIPESELDAHFTGGYGIFSGQPDKTAILKFAAKRARWVADERWHPQQQARFLDDGSYELRVPYADSRELVLDILRHGSHVEVLAPEELRIAVADQLAAALRLYGR